MEKEKLKNLSKDQLKKKEGSLKIFIGITTLLIIGLLYFVTRDYFNEGTIDWAILTITICTVSVPVTLYPSLKEVQKELRTRI